MAFSKTSQTSDDLHCFNKRSQTDTSADKQTIMLFIWYVSAALWCLNSNVLQMLRLLIFLSYSDPVQQQRSISLIPLVTYVISFFFPGFIQGACYPLHLLRYHVHAQQNTEKVCPIFNSLTSKQLQGVHTSQLM